MRWWSWATWQAGLPAWGSGSVSGPLVLQVPFEEVGESHEENACCRSQDIVPEAAAAHCVPGVADGQQDVDVPILQALLKGEGQVRRRMWGVSQSPRPEEPEIPPMGRRAGCESSRTSPGHLTLPLGRWCQSLMWGWGGRFSTHRLT